VRIPTSSEIKYKFCSRFLMMSSGPFFLTANENKCELNACCRHVRESGWSREKAEASFRKHSQQLRQALIIQHNCHMAKLFLPVFIQVRNPLLFDLFCINWA
jgi:hypothetical protein